MALRTITTQRDAPPGNQWQEALKNALQAAVGADKCTGGGSALGKIVFYLTDLATADDENTLRTLITGYDTNTRTPAQQTKAVLTTDLDDVMARYSAGNLHSKTPAEIYTLIQGQVDGWASLADAKAGLRTILPFLAAVCQVYLREKQL